MRAISAAILAMALGACAGVPEPREPAAEDCVEIGIHSNGFHTSLTLPGDALDAEHPLRRLFPEARWLVVGWGDEDFFMAPQGGTFEQGVRATFPGGSTVIRVIAIDVAPERYFAQGDAPRAAVTRAEAAALARFLDGELVHSPEGEAIIVAPAHHPERSYFLRARSESFSLLNNCNHWVARALRAAGLPIQGAIRADAIVARMKRIESHCPDGYVRMDQP
jgi:uncharacterized protein (TIGR02117 family)